MNEQCIVPRRDPHCMVARHKNQLFAWSSVILQLVASVRMAYQAWKVAVYGEMIHMVCVGTCA